MKYCKYFLWKVAFESGYFLTGICKRRLWSAFDGRFQLISSSSIGEILVRCADTEVCILIISDKEKP